MKVYVVQINTEVRRKVFTSLKAACDDWGLNYSSASKGKRLFVRKNKEHVGAIIVITECDLIKIKGRENNGNKKRA